METEADSPPVHHSSEIELDAEVGGVVHIEDGTNALRIVEQRMLRLGGIDPHYLVRSAHPNGSLLVFDGTLLVEKLMVDDALSVCLAVPL